MALDLWSVLSRDRISLWPWIICALFFFACVEFLCWADLFYKGLSLTLLWQSLFNQNILKVKTKIGDVLKKTLYQIRCVLLGSTSFLKSKSPKIWKQFYKSHACCTKPSTQIKCNLSCLPQLSLPLAHFSSFAMIASPPTNFLLPLSVMEWISSLKSR